MSNAIRTCRFIRRDSTSHLPSFKSLGNDPKVKKLDGIRVETKRRQTSFFQMRTAALAAKNGYLHHIV